VLRAPAERWIHLRTTPPGCGIDASARKRALLLAGNW